MLAVSASKRRNVADNGRAVLGLSGSVGAMSSRVKGAIPRVATHGSYLGILKGAKALHMLLASTPSSIPIKI